MGQDVSGAASFFGGPEQIANLDSRIQTSEGNFEERAVRLTLARFGINPKGWDVREKMGARYRFPVFDGVYPNFPVRLGTRRLVAKRLQSEKRRNADLAFHELKPLQLFKPEEFKKTQVYKTWEDLLEDQSVDRRAVGLVFQSIGSVFVVHDWDDRARVDGSRLEVCVDGRHLYVQLFGHFLDQVAEAGWAP